VSSGRERGIYLPYWARLASGFRFPRVYWGMLVGEYVEVKRVILTEYTPKMFN